MVGQVSAGHFGEMMVDIDQGLNSRLSVGKKHMTIFSIY